jgi:hypothetical protein
MLSALLDLLFMSLALGYRNTNKLYKPCRGVKIAKSISTGKELKRVYTVKGIQAKTHAIEYEKAIRRIDLFCCAMVFDLVDLALSSRRRQQGKNWKLQALLILSITPSAQTSSVVVSLTFPTTLVSRWFVGLHTDEVDLNPNSSVGELLHILFKIEDCSDDLCARTEVLWLFLGLLETRRDLEPNLCIFFSVLSTALYMIIIVLTIVTNTITIGANLFILKAVLPNPSPRPHGIVKLSGTNPSSLPMQCGGLFLNSW